MELMEILKGAVEKKASDIFLISGLAVSYKENGIITKAKRRYNTSCRSGKTGKRDIPPCRQRYFKVRGNGR